MKAVVADYRYRVMCLRIVPTIGQIVRLVHYPVNLKMSNGEVYTAFQGNDVTSYSSGTGMSSAVVDLEGVFESGGITRDQIASGIYDGARCYLFATTWKNPIEDEEPIVSSFFGRVTLTDGRFKVEEMALIDALNQSVGEQYSPACGKLFGGQGFAGCKVDLEPLKVTGTVTSVVDVATIVDSSRTEDPDYFGAGTLRFTTGPNAGLAIVDVKRFETGGVIEVYDNFFYTPEVGDEYEMTPGCRHRLEDCQRWNNVINFGGFSFIPTGAVYSTVGTK